MFIYEVFVTNASLNVNQTFSYFHNSFIDNYRRVEVIFNRVKNTGIIVSSIEIDDLNKFEKNKGFKINQIIKVLDDEAIINQEQYDLANWLSKVTISPFISCLNAMLPKTLRTSKAIKKPKEIELIKIIHKEHKFTAKQEEVFSKLYDEMPIVEARKLSFSIIKKFLDEGFISKYLEEKKYVGNNLLIKDENFKKLTFNQSEVFKKVLCTDKLVSLLFGVTGSGKTEVYLHLAREYIKKGKEVLILVPEISLTPQMIERVKDRFNDVIFYHSELSDQERYEQYKRVQDSNVKIVVGTRSSVFLPFKDLGLIIIDEEHDASYKQDNTPCYNAKDVAIRRAITHKAKILLASATPSLESYTRGLKGDYQFLKLEKRINNQLPEIEIVDLVNEIKDKSSYIVSNRLKNEIKNTLNNNKQVIILLNRRGYSPIIKCASCGTTLMCFDCDVPLNYHKDINKLKCHQCGRIYNTLKKCPKCKSDQLIYYGFGTKRVEELLNELYPYARIERMDRDNVSKKGSHKEILTRFQKHEIDILIGTQMIAKGLDYPDVTLVGLLNADSGLAHQDYNAAKMTFDLLMQASGRSGRSKDKGRVIIQAFNPEHYVLKAVLNQDYNYFYNIEMNYRSKTAYPPYSHIVEVLLSDTSDQRLNNSLSFWDEKMSVIPYKHYKPTQLPKLNGKNRYRILITDKDIVSLIKEIWNILNIYLQRKGMSNIKIDIDPLYLE